MRRDFAAAFARALLADPESVYYRELRRAENVDRHNVPSVEAEEQRLLAFLCADASDPDGPQLLWTFIFSDIDVLSARGAGSLAEVLNAPLGDYHERGRWVSPPFAALYLLRIVVPRVAADPHAQALNLFVADSFVCALLASLSPAPDVDLTDEFPTPIHYLIDDCVSFLAGTGNISRTRSQELQRVIDAQHERAGARTIPSHAVAVLGSVMYRCLRSGKLNARFKAYLLTVWWRAYRGK